MTEIHEQVEMSACIPALDVDKKNVAVGTFQTHQRSEIYLPASKDDFHPRWSRRSPPHQFQTTQAFLERFHFLCNRLGRALFQ